MIVHFEEVASSVWFKHTVFAILIRIDWSAFSTLLIITLIHILIIHVRVRIKAQKGIAEMRIWKIWGSKMYFNCIDETGICRPLNCGPAIAEAVSEPKYTRDRLNGKVLKD